MAQRVSRAAAQDLDDIWSYVSVQSSAAVATRLVQTLVDRFLLLARYPRIGRRRDHDLRPGLRSFPVGSYIILYRIEEEDVVILRVIHGGRDIGAQAGDL